MPSPSSDLDIPCSDAVSLCLRHIAAGAFLMGGDTGRAQDEPVHEVTISRPFYLGQYPVTQRQWSAVVGDNPSEFPGDEHPVDSVNWDDCQAFCNELSGRSGRCIRLPTEAEWEYACRAGTQTKFCFGDDEGRLRAYAWFELISGGKTHPVGQLEPNAWGLHDVHGNVWEWCRDVWHGDYEGAPDDGSAWLEGAEEQPRRVLRGGSWYLYERQCLSAYRSWEWRQQRMNHFGLRVVVEI